MIISNVRMESAAGFYLGSIEFIGQEAQPYDRDSMYYPSEELLHNDYANSISLKEAFEKGEAYNRLRRK
ncbi:hypothetical protein V7128_02005 [Neobacillus vireti]|uniref:hypothetical protein n=1 Tax=Neobacillus vireti TaxID=220686 RepID=UPI002FFEB0E0